jgi:hypothetical protein
MSTSSKKPENIFELKQTLTELKKDLGAPENNTQNAQLISEVTEFFSTKYSVTSSMSNDLLRNEQKIKSIEAFDTRYSEFVTACESYVNTAKEIFVGLDKIITDGIKFDESFYTSVEKDLLKLIDPTIKVIDELKKKEPASSSSDAALTEEDKKINEYLDKLIKFLNEMVKKLIDIIKSEVDTNFFNDQIKKLIKSDPIDYEQHITEKINKMLDTFLQNVTSEEDTFRGLLIQSKSGSSVDKIIVDDSIQRITSSFNDMIAELQNFFKENGKENTLIDMINEIYKEKIPKIIKTIDQKVVDLGNVPVMADEGEAEGAAEGGGNGDGSTLATYPVSNKSQKNRNKGKGNSKGRGKGKGKGRKPNATKKNNRH